MESPLIAAQRAAILEARSRYERGEIPVESFKSALDAITEAQDPAAVQAVIAGLPVTRQSALAALDPAPLAPVASTAINTTGRGVSVIKAFMGETVRGNHPWTLAPRAKVVCTMGETVVDLRQAKLPPHCRMSVKVLMGETRILVPPGVRVSARTQVVMGEAVTLGENIAGMVASGQEEYEPHDVTPTAEIEIHARVIMGELRVTVVDPTTMTIKELIRDAMREATLGIREGIRKGLADGLTPHPALNPGNGE